MQLALLTLAARAISIGPMPDTPNAGGRRPRNQVAASWLPPEDDSLAPFNPAWILIGFTATIILAGAVLLWMPVSANGGQVSFLDALFTSASAATTTGLATVDTITTWSYTGHNVIWWLIIFGGAGSLVGSTILLLLIAGRVTKEERPLLKEFTGVQSARGMIVLILGIVIFAFLVQIGGAYLLAKEFSATMPSAMAWWMARFHAVSAFNNAGFDLLGMPTQMPPASVQLTLTALSFFGALGFIVVVDLIRGVFQRKLSVDSKLVLAGTGAIILVGIVSILAAESGNPQTLGPLLLPQKLMSAFFHSVTARTTGYATADIGLFTNASLLVIIALMFIGGASGSTSGGIKVNTFSLLIAVTWSFIRGRGHASAFGSKISEEHVNRALAIVLLSVMVVFVVTLALSLTEHKTLLALLFETVSAFSTTGLSMNLTPTLSSAGKVLIILAMFAGKVGPLTLAFAISQRQRPSYHTYAEEAVNLG